jgi:hypothetical protein
LDAIKSSRVAVTRVPSPTAASSAAGSNRTRARRRPAEEHGENQGNGGNDSTYHVLHVSDLLCFQFDVDLMRLCTTVLDYREWASWLSLLSWQRVLEEREKSLRKS